MQKKHPPMVQAISKDRKLVVEVEARDDQSECFQYRSILIFGLPRNQPKLSVAKQDSAVTSFKVR